MSKVRAMQKYGAVKYVKPNISHRGTYMSAYCKLGNFTEICINTFSGDGGWFLFTTQEKVRVSCHRNSGICNTE
jgi:hypothetical protein